MRMKREEMFAEGCALVRLIGSLPASRSQVNRGGTPLARVQNSNYADYCCTMRVCTSYSAVDAPRISPLANKRCVRGIHSQRDAASTAQKYV